MKKKLLVIDDDVSTQDICKLIFEEEYEVMTLNDSSNILNDTFGHPDVIVLDRQLPGADGLTTCRHMKASESTRHIPVIMISASIDIKHQAKEAGAEAALEKPFSIHDLREVVAYWANR